MTPLNNDYSDLFDALGKSFQDTNTITQAESPNGEANTISNEQADAFASALRSAYDSYGYITRNSVAEGLHDSNGIANTDMDNRTRNLTHEEFMRNYNDFGQYAGNFGTSTSNIA
jgi:hypothetical protein